MCALRGTANKLKYILHLIYLMARRTQGETRTGLLRGKNLWQRLDAHCPPHRLPGSNLEYQSHVQSLRGAHQNFFSSFWNGRPRRALAVRVGFGCRWGSRLNRVLAHRIRGLLVR